MEEQVVEALEKHGPQTGSELVAITREDVFQLWRCCRKSGRIVFAGAGRQFLRLDRAVQGYARLSPSIRREFLTYTLLGLERQRAAVVAGADALRDEVREISRAKFELARDTIAGVVESLPEAESIREQVCCLIAGDITYEMSHTVPRPEQSTGQMVRGSDLDIIVIAEEGLARPLLESLDNAIHKRKHFLLVHPEYREEIDYVVKRVSKVREQLKFETFESMVACKILWEGEYLCCSRSVFEKIKRMVDESGVPGKLAALEAHAVQNRSDAETRLLEPGRDLSDGESLHLFYTREEGEEIY
jgi:hypothetical protein